MTKENPELLTKSSTEVGKKCVLCHQPLKEGDYSHTCPRCKALHHQNCWTEKMGCSNLGCPYIETSENVKTAPKLTDDDRAKQYRHPLTSYGPWIITILIVSLVIGLVIYSAINADPRPEISIFVPYYPDSSYLNELTKTMNTRYPDYRFTVIEKAARADNPMYLHALTVSIAGGDPPDIFILAEQDFLAYAKQGAYTDLTQFYADNPSLIESIPPDRLKKATVSGTYMGLPHPDVSLYLGIFSGTKHHSIAEEFLGLIASTLWK